MSNKCGSYFQLILFLIHCLILQIEVKDREAAEASINHIEYMGFLYFPENYTSGLTKYIDDRQYFDLESRLFAHLTNESK